MTRSIRIRLMSSVALAMASVSLFGMAPTATAALPATPVIVDLRPGTNPARFAETRGIEPKHLYTEFMTGFSAVVSLEQLAEVKGDPRVLAVMKDRVVARRPPVERFRKSGFESFVGDLPPGSDGVNQFVSAEIRRVDADESSTAAIDGSHDPMNVDIAILDGGVDVNHPDLNVVGGYNCVGRRGNRAWGVDSDGHGTFIAGQAAARDNGFGVVGVAPGARIHSVVTFDENAEMTLSQYACGLDWLNRMAPRLEVVNLSFTLEDDGLGGCNALRARPFDRFHWGVCRIVNRGVTVVAGAGNETTNAAGRSPALYKESITVSAIHDYDGEPGGLSLPREECFPDGDVDDTFAFFSNFGEVVDVAAPGVCNISTWPGGRYAVAEGTSFATPLVAGGAALLMAKHPRMTPAQVRAKIIATAESGPIPGDPDEYPEGILDVSSF
jgi:subtilisin family serine protease